MFPLPFLPGHILARAADNATVLLKWVLTSDGGRASSGDQIKDSQPGGWSPNGRRRHKEHGGGTGGARPPHRAPPYNSAHGSQGGPGRRERFGFDELAHGARQFGYASPASCIDLTACPIGNVVQPSGRIRQLAQLATRQASDGFGLEAETIQRERSGQSL